MMETLDRRLVRAPLAAVFAAARDVERWPAILPHYRWVRRHPPRPDRGAEVVEMAAWRPFGPLRWPTWWMSEMWVDEARAAVRYRHIAGITRGMDVEWSLTPRDGGTEVVILHRWDGPAWPLIRRPAAEWIIGPVFVHGIASRTLAGIARHVEGGTAGGRDGGTAGRRAGGTPALRTEAGLSRSDRPAVPPCRRPAE